MKRVKLALAALDAPEAKERITLLALSLSANDYIGGTGSAPTRGKRGMNSRVSTHCSRI